MTDAFNDDDLSPGLRRMYDVYLENLYRGCMPEESALRAGISRENVINWIRIAECDSYVIDRKAALDKAFKASSVWNEAIAVVSLARMAFNENERGANRLAAMKELNVLCGITEVDDAGRTHRVPGLNDLYPDDPTPEVESRPTTH